jgi:hypothetical protein
MTNNTSISGKINDTKKFVLKSTIILVTFLMVFSMVSIVEIGNVNTKNINYSNQKSIVPFVSSKALSLSLDPTLSSGDQNENIIIYANVTYNGVGVSGARVTFTDTNGNSFLPSTITTNSSGVGIVTYYIQNSNQATDTITGLANLTGYQNATATTTINDITGSNDLAASINLGTSDISSGSTDVIYGHVASIGGTSISGASVSISSPIYEIFSPFTVTTDSQGNYYANFTAGKVTIAETSIIEVSVSQSGYGSSSADTTINVEPFGATYLSVKLLSTNPQNPSQNGFMTVSARVLSGLRPLEGASVSFSDSFGSTFSPLSSVTNVTGYISANVHISNSNSGYDLITASATFNGYTTSEGVSYVFVNSGSSQLTVTGNLQFGSINSNETDTISGTVYSGGQASQIVGAQISASDTAGSNFINIPTYSVSSGSYYISFIVPSVKNEINDTITITATDSGYSSSSSSFLLTILPTSAGTLQENLTLLGSSKTIAQGDSELIQVNVTSHGKPVSGATVAISDNFGSTFSALSGSTNSTGTLIESVDFSTSNYGIDIIYAKATLAGYYSGQSSLEVNVLQGTSSQLSVTASLGISSTTSNSTDIITGTVFQGGSTNNKVTGATISVSDTANSNFYSSTSISGSSGSFYIEFSAAYVKTETNDTITVTVSDTGYAESSSSVMLTILPGNTKTLSVIVSEIYPVSGMESNGQGVAVVKVESAGKPVDNSLVSFSDSIGSTFGPSTATTNVSGVAYVPFELPNLYGGGIDILTASASENGYISASGADSISVSGYSSSDVGVTISLQSSSISPGSTVIISGNTYSFSNNGIFAGCSESSIGGATVSLSDSAGSSFSSQTVISSSSGSFTTSMTVPLNFKGSLDVITAVATLSGHTSGSSSDILSVSNSFSAVNFVEKGLPSGTTWGVTFDGSSQTSSTNSTLFNVANGIYTYTVQPMTGYEISPPTGTITVSNSGMQVNITFKQVDFPIVFTESGLPSGTSWSVNLSGSVLSSTSNTITFNERNGSYAYEIVPVNGYSVSTSSGTFISSGGYNAYVTFQQRLYTATLKEKGLPLGYHWSATLGSFTLSSESNVIQFSVPNGTYPYSINVPAGYSAANQSGQIQISGNGASQIITFTQTLFTKYSATFEVSGLSSSAIWTLDVNGNSSLNTVTSIQMNLPVGNYTYTVNASGYTTENASGSFNISNSNIIIKITFEIDTKYIIEFDQSGLSGGLQWNVTLNGIFNSSTGSSMEFHEPNGNYSYVIDAPSGYTVTPDSGTLTVSSGTVTVNINFQKVQSNTQNTKYSVMFIESGLSSGTTWAVTFNGTVYNSSTTSITEYVLSGTYPFNVSAISGYSESPTSGSVTISGGNEVIGITFQKVTTFQNTGYNVTFIESGLPSNVQWYVTFNGQTKSVSGTSIYFSELNGTYSYSVGKISGYAVSPGSGFITINGKNIVIGINYLKQSSATSTNSPSNATNSNILGIPQTYVLGALISLIVVGSVVGALVGSYIRKRP